MDTQLKPPETNSGHSEDNDRYTLRQATILNGAVFVMGSIGHESLENLLLEKIDPPAIVVCNSKDETQAVWVSPTMKNVGPLNSVPVQGSLKQMIELYGIPASAEGSYLTEDFLLVQGTASITAHRWVDYLGDSPSDKAGKIGHRAAASMMRLIVDHGTMGIILIFLVIARMLGTFEVINPTITFLYLAGTAAVGWGFVTHFVIELVRKAAIRRLSRDTLEETVFLFVPTSYVLLLPLILFSVVVAPLSFLAGVLLGSAGWKFFDRRMRGRVMHGEVLLGTSAPSVPGFLGRHWSDDGKVEVKRG